MDFNALQKDLEVAASGNAAAFAGSGNTIYDKYVFLEELGHGAYGSVSKARKKASPSNTTLFFAVKHIDKKKAGTKGLKEVFGEVETMSLLNHPNIVRLEETFQDEANLWIVMEYVAGGELQKSLKARGSFSENATRHIVTQIILAMEYIHNKGIVHRDMKPANCLLHESGDQLLCKIADFGFAVLVGSDQCLTSFCGTTAFMAPEIIMDVNYGKPVDMWAVGVILYLLLCGEYPFVGSAKEEIGAVICGCRYNTNHPKMVSASPGLRDFLSKLLMLDPNKRYTAKDSLKHPWIKHAMTSTSTETTRSILREAAGGEIGEHHRRHDMSLLQLFRCTVHIVVATQRMIYLRRISLLRRNGADFPVLRCYGFLVSGRSDVTQLLCSGVFSGNPRAVQFLLPMVEGASQLEVLDLSSNNIDNMDLVQQIVKAVTNHTSLMVLNLENNPIPALAGRSLLRLARSQSKLRVIRVSGTLVAADIVAQILAALKDRRALGLPGGAGGGGGSSGMLLPFPAASGGQLTSPAGSPSTPAPASTRVQAPPTPMTGAGGGGGGVFRNNQQPSGGGVGSSSSTARAPSGTGGTTKSFTKLPPIHGALSGPSHPRGRK